MLKPPIYRNPSVFACLATDVKKHTFTHSSIAIACMHKAWDAAKSVTSLSYRRVSHGLGWPTKAMFFYNRIRKKQFFTMLVGNEKEIVRNTPDGVEGKSGLICLERYIRSCWCRRVSQFLVTLDNG